MNYIRTKLILALALTIFLVGLSALPRASADNPRIVRKIDYGMGDPDAGLAWDGQYLWVADTNADEIRKIDPSKGNVIKDFVSPETNPKGLAWDGQYLWNAAQANIYKIDPVGGTRVGSIDTDLYGPRGLAWDGTMLWYGDTGTDKIYRIDPSDGTVVKSFDSPGISPSGLAWDGQYLWNVDWNDDTVYKLDPSDGTVVKSFNSLGSSPSGLAWDGQYLWNVDWNDERLEYSPYKMATTVYSLSTSSNPSSGGSVSLDPLGDSYAEGTTVTASADADSGYGFDHWSGDVSGSSSSIDITMSSDKNITAHFVKQFSLSADSLSGGAVSLDPSGGTYDSGTVVTVTASPDSGYKFDHWSGDASGTSSSIDITMDSDKSVTAHFKKTGGGADGAILAAIFIVVIIGIVGVVWKKGFIGRWSGELTQGFKEWREKRGEVEEEAPKKTYCENCDLELPPEAEFCPECGEKVS